MAVAGQHAFEQQRALEKRGAGSPVAVPFSREEGTRKTPPLETGVDEVRGHPEAGAKEHPEERKVLTHRYGQALAMVSARCRKIVGVDFVAPEHHPDLSPATRSSFGGDRFRRGD